MAVNKDEQRTCLSTGKVLREILTRDAAVKEITTRIFPVVATNAKLPYIAYRRTQLTSEAVRDSKPADSTMVEVVCYAENYDQSIDLAEAVRAALDCKAYRTDSGLLMRHCKLTDGEEGWENDAFVQQLIFEVKI